MYNQEANRQANETQRQANEETRQNQEETRESNEEIRKANELERQENETKREENEQAREEYIEQLKQQVLSGEVGNGIESIELINGTHKAGELDTYQITYTDGTTKDIQVYNGKDGTGTGDMMKEIYDTDDDGVVEEADHAKTSDNATNAENSNKVNNHTVNTDVPEDAVFTDTITKYTTGTTKIAKGTTITNGYSVTLPIEYTVGNNSLEVRAGTEVLILATSTTDGHYKEVGNAGEQSNKITMYRTSADGSWTLEEELILTEIVRGVETK